MTTGSTPESPLSLAKSICALILESDCFHTSTVASTEARSDPNSTITPQPRSSDGVCSSSRSSNWSRRTRRETTSSSTLVSFPQRDAECSTELPLSISRRKRLSNDVKIYLSAHSVRFWIITSYYYTITYQSDSGKNFNAFVLSIFLVFRGLRLWDPLPSGDAFFGGISMLRKDLYLSSRKNCAILVYCSSLKDFTLWKSSCES